VGRAAPAGLSAAGTGRGQEGEHRKRQRPAPEPFGVSRYAPASAGTNGSRARARSRVSARSARARTGTGPSGGRGRPRDRHRRRIREGRSGDGAPCAVRGPVAVDRARRSQLAFRSEARDIELGIAATFWGRDEPEPVEVEALGAEGCVCGSRCWRGCDPGQVRAGGQEGPRAVVYFIKRYEKL
jgi:hypothetical protein